MKRLLSSLLIGMLGFAMFVFLGGLASARFTLTESAIIGLVPTTVFLLIVLVGRLASPREPWSSPILDLHSRQWRGPRFDIDQMLRRRARLRFSDWNPGTDVTIH